MAKNTRAGRILQMATSMRDEQTIQALRLPLYETTKGTTASERNLAVFGFDNYNLDNKHSTQDTTISSSEKTKTYFLRDVQDNVNVKRRLINLEEQYNSSDIISSTCPNADEIDFEESEEEYVPSSGASSTTSDFSSDTENLCSSQLLTEYMSKTQEVSCSVKPFPSTSNDIDNNIHVNHVVNLSSTTPQEVSSSVKQVVSTSNSSHVVNLSSKTHDSVTVPVSIKGDSGKRLRNKIHSCFLCNKILSNNMARHFERMHGQETEVAKILAMPKQTKRRREAFEYLIRVGDFYHNCNVLSTNQGELILVRRPETAGKFCYADFGPCPNCLGFFLKKYLWHHKKYGCNIKKSASVDCFKKGPLNESSALLFQIIGKTTSSDFRRAIVESFRSDSIAAVCKADELILNLGSFLFEKYGLSQAELIRQSMRQLGRLKLELQKLDEDCINLKDCIVPAKFDTVILATKALCDTAYNAGEKRNEFGIPSLAVKIGHLLRKCVAIEKGTALKTGRIQQSKIYDSFITLMEIEWSTRISSNALLTMHKRKMNTKQLLPLTSDLLKLNMHLKQKMEKLKKEIFLCCNRYTWSQLASVTLCKIILFNKRRSGEASKMTLQQYSSRPSWSEQGTDELKDSLSPMERELANKLVVVEIVGKRNRTVPVILTNEVKNSIDILLNMRSQAEISNENQHIFARSQASQLNSHLRGHDCLRNECSDAGLTQAENVTSTKLRKYVATVSQIFDLKEHECDWLARHLGHDIRVHRDFYRLHESAIEVTKVSRLLLAIDSGNAQRFAGKPLEEINIDDLPDVETDSDREDMEGDDNQGEIKKSCTVELEKIAESHAVSNSSSKQRMRTQSKKNPVNKKLWSSEEKQIVLECFATLIKHNQLPGKEACEDCINSNAVLKQRKWSDLKFFIKNHLTKLTKLKA